MAQLVEFIVADGGPGEAVLEYALEEVSIFRLSPGAARAAGLVVCGSWRRVRLLGSFLYNC